MKYYNKFLMVIASSAFLVSCADNFESDLTIDKPEDITRYEYLNAYDALKTYIDRNANPNFKLGAGVTVSDFIKKELVYSVMASNFDEVTAGNAMKYSSCVGDDGSMDFSQVAKFVDVARSGGLTIYGHTLAWHAQQNNKYLNGLIADKPIEVDPDAGDNCLHINTPEAKNDAWEWEIYYNLLTPLTKGVEYTISMRAKASAPVEVLFWPGDGTDTQYLPGFNIGTEWGETSVTFTADYDLNVMRFCFGTFGGDLYFDDLSLKATGSDQNLIANSSFDEPTLNGWTKPSWHSYTYVIEKDVPEGGSNYLHINTPEAQADPWSWEIYYNLSTPLTKGVEYTIGMRAKASTPTEVQFWPGDGTNTQYLPSFSAGKEWGETSVTFTADYDLTIMRFCFGQFGGDLYFDDLYLKATGSDENLIANPSFDESTLTGWTKPSWHSYTFTLEPENKTSIEMTPEEKAEVLTLAMDRWVKGMMEACEGYVAVWDVVNEAISGRDVNGDGYYELQSAVQGTVSEEDIKNNFYWQDYLGDIEYVRTTIKLARQYYQEFGGNPSDLKLFINDYNLESDWDDNNKLKSLINWIKRWEEDGTVVDGIGTQMHVSYHADPAIQESKEKHIVKMYELMAATGKLVKVSELDMGYVDEDGNSVLTENMTEEQHKAMAGFYTFIIKKYFEIIPVAQRYGITQWAPTDSPNTEYSWRKGEPIGLWNLNYNRKHTYGGFADGLAGK